MVHQNSTILMHIKEVLNEHMLPIADIDSELTEAAWLVEILQKTEDVYSQNGTF